MQLGRCRSRLPASSALRAAGIRLTGHVGIVEVVAVVLEGMNFPSDDGIGGIPGQ